MVNQNIYEVFRNRLRMLMHEKGYKQKDIADNVHVTKQAVNNYFKKDVLPDVVTLMEIADLFGTSTDYLLGISETRLSADDLRITTEALDANALKRMTVLMKGEATAGLRFINTLLNTDDFYKSLVYLNKACGVQRLKDIEPSVQSNAYISAVKLTNMMESTKAYVMDGGDVVEYYTDKAIKTMSEIMCSMVRDAKEKVDND